MSIDNSKRVKWIDVLKGLCMIFVMISHASPPAFWTYLFTPFFLSGFFFASGYTFSVKKDAKTFFGAKFKGLIIPLFSFSLINGIVGILFKNTPIYKRILGMLLERAGGLESLWFIACLFTVDTIFYFIIKWAKNDKYILMISFLFSCLGLTYMHFTKFSLPWQFEIACGVMIFFALGYEYRKSESTFLPYFRTDVYFLFFLVYVFLCLGLKNYVNVHDKVYGNEIIYMISSFLGIYVICGVSRFLEKSKILLFIGQKSLVYFAFQGFLLSTIRAILLRIGFPLAYTGCLCLIVISQILRTIFLQFKFSRFPVGFPRT